MKPIPRQPQPPPPPPPPPRASARALCQVANWRACRTLQCADASRNAASLDGDATSANGSTRSKDNAPDASPSARHGRDSRFAADRTHCRAVDVLTPHWAVTQLIMETAPSPRQLSARSNSAMSASCSPCRAEIAADRATIFSANSCERGSPPKFRHGGRRRSGRAPTGGRCSFTKRERSPRSADASNRVGRPRGPPIDPAEGAGTGSASTPAASRQPPAVSRRRRRRAPDPRRAPPRRARHAPAATRDCAHADLLQHRNGSARPAPRQAARRRPSAARQR